MKKSKSIRWQITGAFLGFLVLALGLIIFLNMTFMEQYYLENKKEILKTSYETIAKEYDAVDKTDTLKFASTNNLSFVIIDWNGSEPKDTAICGTVNQKNLQRNYSDIFIISNRRAIRSLRKQIIIRFSLTGMPV